MRVNLSEGWGMTGVLKKISRIILAASVVGICLVSILIASTSEAKADDLPLVYAPESIQENTTWTNDNIYVIDDNTSIPTGVTLAIEAGTIVKIDSGRLEIAGGHLDIDGSALSHVVITSIEDDSVGGDTGGDGATSGSSGDYNKAVYGTSGSLSVEYATIRYGNYSIDAEGSMTSADITDSIINSTVVLAGEALSVHVERNVFDVSVGYAVYAASDIDISGIILEGGNANAFNGMGQNRALYLAGVSIPASKSWNVPQGPILRISNIEVEGSLTLHPGAVIKVDSGSTNKIIDVKSGGLFSSLGSNTNPVTITSIKDDSLGGDTGGDGSSTLSTAEYGTAVWDTSVQDISITHTFIRYSKMALGIHCASSKEATIVGNDFQGTVFLNGCDASKYSLQSNNIIGTTDYAIHAENTQLGGIKLSGADTNILSGSGRRNTVFAGGEVSAGQSWEVSDVSGASIVVYYVHVYGNLDIQGEVIVKRVNNSWSAGKITIHDGGAISVDGGTGRAIFTSMSDDSVGGDTGDDGPTIGSFDGYVKGIVVVNPGAKADIRNATLRYAETAALVYGEAYFEDTEISDALTGIDTEWGGHVVFRGSFRDIANRAVKACKWSSNYCSVDASYVDWGSATGPFSTTGDDMACGRVVVSPWVDGSLTYDEVFEEVKNCDGTSALDTLSTAASDFNNAVAAKQIDCGQGIQDACNAINSAFACYGSAINVAASTSPIPVSFSTPTQTLNNSGSEAATAANLAFTAATTQTPEAFTPANKILIGNVMGLFGSLVDAYNNCRPY
jgi:hypothetical protein